MNAYQVSVITEEHVKTLSMTSAAHANRDGLENSVRPVSSTIKPREKSRDKLPMTSYDREVTNDVIRGTDR